MQHFAGVQPTRDGLLIRPALPTELGAYSWSTGLSELAWDGDSIWTGTYSPMAPGTYNLTADLGLVAPVSTCVTIEVRAEGTRRLATADGAVGQEAVTAAVELRFTKGGMEAVAFVITTHDCK